MPETQKDDYATRILLQLLLLREAGALECRETLPGSGVHRWSFRAAGWPVAVDLDTSVLEMRVYHARDEVAMTRTTEKLMNQLLGKAPLTKRAGPPATESAAIAALREAVADWKRDNPRIFVRPPEKVGHPDNWNRA